MRDIDVRNALHAKVLDEHHGDPNTLVLDELGLWYGVARVDIAVVNGRMHGFEIKSDRDTLDRLPEQARIYGRVLDRVTVVVGHIHAEAVRHIIPEWWGIKVATRGPRGAVHFADLRAPTMNPAVDPVAVAALLWREELLEILDGMGAARGLRGKSRDVLSRRLVELLPLDDLRATVRARLKVRPLWRVDAPQM
ncbi:sce7726 family protein [Corallococcus sp. NCSPR001]|nr:sce7726 family protein [Corallococcus sp. NCSPR001]